MNNWLRGKRIYLAGPVEANSAAANWRDIITRKLNNLDMIVLNPLIKPPWLGNITGETQREIKRRYNKSQCLSECDKIVNHAARQYCLSLVRMCDLIVVYFNGNTVGTYEELAIAKDKPIFVIKSDMVVESMWLMDLLNIYSSQEFEFYYKQSIRDFMKTIRLINKYGFRFIGDKLNRGLNPLKSPNGDGAFLEDKFKWIFLSYNQQEEICSTSQPNSK